MTRTSKMLTALLLAVFTAGSAAWGQSAENQATLKSVKLAPVSETDLYCGGFITKSGGVSHANFIEGGWTSPNAARFAAGEYIYITGPELKSGEMFSIVRAITNPDRAEMFRGQYRAVAAVGEPYAEIGRAKIVGAANGSSIAQIVFSCETALAGDYVVPF